MYADSGFITTSDSLLSEHYESLLLKFLESEEGICLVRVRCATFRKESVMPEEATSRSASVKASVQPEASKTSPNVFQRAISICKPPIITCIDSSYTSGHFHCISFARANRG